MKIRIQFEREASYSEKKLQLVLMRYFNPTKFMWMGGASSWGSKPEVAMEGADPVNPFEAMEQVNAEMAKQVKNWSYAFTITYIEMESPAEKEKIATWVLMDKLKPGVVQSP